MKHQCLNEYFIANWYCDLLSQISLRLTMINHLFSHLIADIASLFITAIIAVKVQIYVVKIFTIIKQGFNCKSVELVVDFSITIDMIKGTIQEGTLLNLNFTMISKNFDLKVKVN